MVAEKLNFGDTIGIVSPSHVATVERYSPILSAIESKGFKVKTGENLYKNTYGYLATEIERANDFNNMVSDKSVKMIFFGGGNGSIELLPYIDYENIKKNPKIFLSYSDGTSILNAIHSKTGLITYYGQGIGEFENMTDYNYNQFITHLVKRDAKNWVHNSEWHSLKDGVCEGVLIGGYTLNFALSVNSSYLKIDTNKKYVLFLEDYEAFNDIASVSAFLSYLEQSSFIHHISGLLFGHYSETIYPEFMERLMRFGEKYNVPVAYCDDFGHGINHAILPVGGRVILNTKEITMQFC